jgi:hypothetical protein
MNLFQVITIMAFFMLLPVSILVEGLPCLPSKLAAAVSRTTSSGHMTLAGRLFHDSRVHCSDGAEQQSKPEPEGCSFASKWQQHLAQPASRRWLC